MNFCPASSASRNRRYRSHCSRRTNCVTSVGVSRIGRLVGRTGSETVERGIGERHKFHGKCRRDSSVPHLAPRKKRLLCHDDEARPPLVCRFFCPLQNSLSFI